MVGESSTIRIFREVDACSAASGESSFKAVAAGATVDVPVIQLFPCREDRRRKSRSRRVRFPFGFEVREERPPANAENAERVTHPGGASSENVAAGEPYPLTLVDRMMPGMGWIHARQTDQGRRAADRRPGSPKR